VNLPGVGSLLRMSYAGIKGKAVFAVLRSAVLLLGAALRVCAQTPDPTPPGPPADAARPPLIPLPQLENWSFLKDPDQRTDFFDPVKYIEIGNGDSFLSFGLEYRIEYERYTAYNFGIGPQDQNGYLLQRLLPHVDLHLTKHFRVYTEFQFDYAEYRNGGPRPGIDEDRGDIHQLFFDLGSDATTGAGFSLRAGRQEIVEGRGRLLDNNEGPTVKLSFDGFKLRYSASGGSIDLFAVKPVNDNPGFFDDAPIHTQSLWGAYASNIAVGSLRPKIDLYYLGFDNKNASYTIGQGREIRHTVGGRFDQAIGNGFDFDWESAFQWGSFTDHTIRAYTVQTETGYTFANSPGHIRPFLRCDVSSGGGSNDPNNPDLETFNSLFPRGAYITPKAPPPFALDNVVDVHPMVWFRPFAHVETSVGWDWFWRYSLADSLYSLAGFPVVQGDLSKDRYIMQMGDMEVRWSPAPHVILAFNFMGTINGAFLNSTVRSRNITYSNVGFTYRF
jgi:hypothetical protein